MAAPFRRPPRPRQRGYMLIFVLALVGMIGLFFLVNGLSATGIQQQRDAATADALAQAKAALIARAAADTNRPGSLPCPDLATNIPGNNVPGDGKADLLSGNNCPSYVGWLPWQTLGLPDLRDGSGERLWYALSPSLRDDDSAQPINSNTPGNLALDATPGVAALVFAPGSPLAGQSRPSNNAADYLDGNNAIPNQTNFVSGPAGANFNDRALAITRDELFRLVAKRVLAEMRGTGSPAGNGLLKYQADNGGIFPWADISGDYHQDAGQPLGKVPVYDLNTAALPVWLIPNNWHAIVGYKLPGPGQTAMTIDLSGNSISCIGATCQ